MKNFSIPRNWSTRLVFHKNDTPELIVRKKFFLITNFIAIVFLSGLATLSWLLDLNHFTGYLVLILAYNIVQSILLVIIRKWSRWFVYSVFSLYMVLIFYIILRLGGLANSAGLLMAAYFFLLMAQWMKDVKLLFLIGVLYVTGVLIAGISFPYLTVDTTLSGWKNNLFYAINYAWIGLLIAVALYSTIVKSENEAKSKAAHLLELDLLKSKLYANIAHEFRTPLTLIKGTAQEIGEHHHGEILERAQRICQNSDKILHLVNQMLNLSSIEEGRVQMHYVQSDLVAFTRITVDSFRGYAVSRKIKLHFMSFIPKLLMDIDPGKLEESLSNLLTNAIKYTPEGGDVFVTVRIPECIENLAYAPERVEISVRDTGIGIPDEQLDKIFIRFYRVEDQRYPFQEGSGIGLTLVSEYLRMMNGSISVSSKPDEGSEFIMVLPVTHKAEILDVVNSKDPYAFNEVIMTSKSGNMFGGTSHPCLLIIEDNRELSEYLAKMLKNEYQILTAENGIEGTERARELIPDIILCDVMMPGKDGYQVCKELKNDFRTNHIPIVFLTARADAGSRIAGLEQGADAYLTKPFDKRELMVCLQNLLVQREKLRLKYQSGLYDHYQQGNFEGLSEKFLKRTITILEKNYPNENFGIEDLYKILGISRVQLHRKLTALTGQSASTIIRSYRLQKARKLLVETGKNVSEIAFEVGFSDPNYFTRAFTREHGLSPTDLRKSFT